MMMRGSTFLRKIKGKKERTGEGALEECIGSRDPVSFTFSFFFFRAAEQSYAGTAAGVENLY